MKRNIPKILEEEIVRMKELMGLLFERACDIKFDDEKIKVKEYWKTPDNLRTPSEIENFFVPKMVEIDKLIQPILIETKTYYLRYVKTEKFQTKMSEFYNKSNKTWDQNENTELENFINSIKIIGLDPYKVYQKVPDYNESILGFVSPSEYDIIYVVYGLLYPKISLEKPKQIILHEMNHCINDYFLYKKNIETTTDFETQKTDDKTYNYAKSGVENWARITNLKNLLGVESFDSLENLQNLLKENLTLNQYVQNAVGQKEELETQLDFSTPGKLKINLKSPYDLTLYKVDPKKLIVQATNFLFKGIPNIDTKYLFFNFTEPIVDTNKIMSGYEINLSDLYNYTQQFAKFNNQDLSNLT